MPLTINDVAKQAGVSKSTVSCYLNGRYEAMSPETREKIAAVIAKLGFRPNALARSLKQKRTHTIAAIVASILNPFTTSIIRGVEDCCQQEGMNLILCNADENAQKEREYLDMLVSKQIDGLIINTTGSNNTLIRETMRHTPVVLLDRKVPELGCDVITVDGVHGSRQAVDHLAAFGRRRIAFFTRPYHHISPREERVQGFQEALAAAGLPFVPEWLVVTETDLPEVENHINRLAQTEGLQIDAIFGANDLMTMAVVKALKRLQIRIPQEIAVLGFDDWEWAPLIDPPVTVVTQPSYEMGRKAAEILIKRIKNNRPVRKPRMVVYEPELIVRKSCGEP